MRTFDYSQMPRNLLTAEINALISQLHEDKGRLSSLEATHPKALEALRKRAFLNNIDASARVEGICVDPKRIATLVDGAEPSRSLPYEGEIKGYALALQLIDQPSSLAIESGTVVEFYEKMYESAGLDDRSRYRRKDYIYTEIEGHMQAVPVSPVPAFETPLVFGGACDALALAFEDRKHSPVLLVGVFSVDFLCIRPFDQGNGRILRLFSDMLLRKAGFNICRYMSVDKLIEESAAEYYEALNSCVMGWDRSRNTYAPFVLYWLNTLHKAYQKLFAAAENQKPASKGDRIRSYVEEAGEPVTKRQILEDNPDISVAMVENVLGKLVKEGAIEKVGVGRATSYQWTIDENSLGE